MDFNALQKPAVSFSDIYITDQLLKRPPRRADYLQEKIALQDLTALMSQAPEEVLPRFVELAMELTDGVSAGLSILEPEAPKVFRWRNLCGSLKVFEGACTPRDDSPCGITLDQARPTLTRYSERGYQWIADTKVILPEVLLVPLYIDGPEPLGTLWVVSDEECHFDSGDARVATELATFVGIALKMKRREERLRAALDAQALLAGEMSHRLKNVFAVTQSLVHLTLKDAGDALQMAEILSGRLQALANAHTLVLPTLANEPNRPLDLAALLEAILKPHQNTRDGKERFVLHGPSFECHAQVGSSIALIVHELATNSVKYGALTIDTGAVDLGWKIDKGFLVLTWQESGGPRVSIPENSGFGSRLVSGAVRQLNGTINCDWLPEGVSVEVRFPLTTVGTLGTSKERA
jgi:two-component sensor histidine kinase